MHSLTELRLEITRINNQVNIEHYGYGVKSQKVFFINDQIILILAHTRRVSALNVLDKLGHDTRDINAVLMHSFKERLRQCLEEELRLDISFVSKDYDTPTETATTVIMLKKPLGLGNDTLR